MKKIILMVCFAIVVMVATLGFDRLMQRPDSHKTVITTTYDEGTTIAEVINNLTDYTSKE